VLRHSIFLAAVIGTIVAAYAHWGGAWTR